MDQEKKNSGPNNIQSKWIEKLGQFTNPKVFKSINKTKISFKMNNSEVQKVLINEEENWFVLKSQNEIVINEQIDVEEFIMALCSKAPIGFFDYKTRSESKTIKLIFKTHQRFIKNDDHININRTIDLHLRDHVLLFFNPISKYISHQGILLELFEAAFNSY